MLMELAGTPRKIEKRQETGLRGKSVRFPKMSAKRTSHVGHRVCVCVSIH